MSAWSGGTLVASGLDERRESGGLGGILTGDLWSGGRFFLLIPGVVTLVRLGQRG